MSAALLVGRHVLQESLRRRVFSVVLVLTLLFLALFTFANAEAFGHVDSFSPGGGLGSLDTRGLVAVTLTGLGMFATLFLGTVLAVFLTLGAVRGDAERGLLQPLVVRPVGRPEFLLGRFAGAAIVCAAYVALLFVAVVVIVKVTGHRWPDTIVGPGLALMAATTVLVGLSLLGSVLLSTVANGIAMFMLFGAGLIGGLLGTIGNGLQSDSLKTIAHDISLALPFEALYQAGLHALTANQTGFTGVLVNLGPFGSSHAGGAGLDVWAAAYLAIVGAVAIARFARADL